MPLVLWPVGLLQKMLHKFVVNIAESAKSFIRWLDGQCEPAGPVRIDDDRPIIINGHRLPIVARAFPVSTPPIAAWQVDVELRVD